MPIRAISWPPTIAYHAHSMHRGISHELKFFFENDASRTSFFLYSFLWPEFGPVTFDACKRHESIYLALLFFSRGEYNVPENVSIRWNRDHCSPISPRIVFHLFSFIADYRKKIDSFERRIFISLFHSCFVRRIIFPSSKSRFFIWNIFKIVEMRIDYENKRVSGRQAVHTSCSSKEILESLK